MRPHDSPSSYKNTGSAVNATNTPTNMKAAPTRSSALASESAFREKLRIRVPRITGLLRLYLGTDEKTGTSGGSGGEKGTISVLLGHIQERVVDAYIAFRKAVEFIPVDADEEGRINGDGPARGFASPDEIRAFFS